MTQNSVYSNKVLFAVRLIAIFTLLLLTFTTGEMFVYLVKFHFYVNLPPKGRTVEYSNIIINLTVIYFSASLIRQPQRFFLIGIGSLLYSLQMSLINSNPYMDLLMLIVAFSTGFLRINSSKHKKVYIAIFAFLYLFELFTPLMKGFKVFVDYAIYKIAISILLFIIVFFFSEYSKQQGFKEGIKDRVLNLAKYEGINRSDMFLLQEILDNKKYKEIAQKLRGSEGALRNKLSKIYKILEVGDRIGFISIYSGYKLIYEPEGEIKTTD